jgi:hypothetical protein
MSATFLIIRSSSALEYTMASAREAAANLLNAKLRNHARVKALEHLLKGEEPMERLTRTTPDDVHVCWQLGRNTTRLPGSHRLRLLDKFGC